MANIETEIAQLFDQLPENLFPNSMGRRGHDSAPSASQEFYAIWEFHPYSYGNPPIVDPLKVRVEILERYQETTYEGKKDMMRLRVISNYAGSRDNCSRIFIPGAIMRMPARDDLVFYAMWSRRKSTKT